MEDAFLLKTRLIVKTLLIGFAICLLAQDCFSQRYNFTSFTIAQGLPNNQVLEIFQDSKGFLWIGTINGACKFDGKSFEKFGQDNLLSNNPVKSIFEDSNHNIWFGITRKGVCRYDGSNFTCFSSNDGLLSDIVNSICEDRKGNIWIGTGDGISVYDGKKFSSLTITNGLINNNVLDIKKDFEGNLWIGTIGGLCKHDGDAFSSFANTSLNENNIIYSVLPAKDEKIWLGTSKGVVLFDGTQTINFNVKHGLINERIQDMVIDNHNTLFVASYGGGIAVKTDTTFKSLTTADGLANNIVHAAFIDREGNYWFGTSNGLSKYSGDRFNTYTSDDGLANNNITSVFCESENRLWFGTLAGGVSYFDGTLFKNFGINEGLKSLTVRSITKDHSGNYWLGTTSGAGFINANDYSISYPVKYLDNIIIYDILESKNGTLYFATDKGIFGRKNNQLKKLGVQQGLFEEKTRVLHEDKKGVLWIGTLKGAYFLNGDSAISFNNNFNIPNAPVTSIISDDEDNILISAFDFGMRIYKRTAVQNPVMQITKANGLNNDRLLFCYLDSKQFLWLGTPDGLDCISWPDYLKENKIIIYHYDKSNGYFGVESNAACGDSTGNVWFGTVNGAIRYNGNSGITRQTVPLVVLNNIQLFLKDVDWEKKGFRLNRESGLPESLILHHDNNYLSFFFSGIYLTAPEEVTYRFMLEGFDTEWSPQTRQSIANFSNVPPGDYIFKVKASANNKDWSIPVTYTFSITPPVWKTPLFYVLYVLFAAGAILLLLQLRTRGLRKLQLQLKKKVDLRTSELNEKNIELEKLSLVASETDNAVLIFNSDKELEWVNAAFTKMTGFSLEEIKGKKDKSIAGLSGNPAIESIVDDCIKNKKSTIYESSMENRNGETFWVSSTLNPIFDTKGFLKNIVVVDTDITYRKKMEEQIRESLHEKGLLLKEIHHRVKNNLQIIISLFNLQSGFINDEKAYKALREGQDRIKSLALIHERFYQSDGTSKIDFDIYVNRLCENLFLSAGLDFSKINLEVEAQNLSLDIDTAVPCGLILNEIVSNSIKHAFPEHRNNGSSEHYKKIGISFSYNSNDVYVLKIKDNGVGLRESIDISNPETLGLQLVVALVDQLEGKMTVNRHSGTEFIIEFKKR